MAESLPVIELNTSDRGIVVGQTGSGKSIFMRELLAPLTRLAVVAPSGTLHGDDIEDSEWNLKPWGKRTAIALKRGKPFRTLIEEPAGRNWNPTFERLRKAGDLVIYIDEIFAVVPPRRPIPTELHAIYTRGRKSGIGSWSATQRPSWVPLEILSEAQWYVCFRLMMDEDRRRMAGLMGMEVMTGIREGDPYGFWIYHVSWDSPRYVPGIEIGDDISSVA